jgi:hypothetical protein
LHLPPESRRGPAVNLGQQLLFALVIAQPAGVVLATKKDQLCFGLEAPLEWGRMQERQISFILRFS